MDCLLSPMRTFYFHDLYPQSYGVLVQLTKTMGSKYYSVDDLKYIQWLL
jgi:hypothetical protein